MSGVPVGFELLPELEAGIVIPAEGPFLSGEDSRPEVANRSHSDLKVH